jgi:5-methylcytosine-specific restriction endonuclease McrA
MKPRNNAYTERDKIILELFGHQKYFDYKHSLVFSKIRKAVLSRDGGACGICGNPASQIHHFQYDRATMLGETLDHLISLCGSCHHDVEFKDGKRVWVQNTRERFNELKK